MNQRELFNIMYNSKKDKKFKDFLQSIKFDITKPLSIFAFYRNYRIVKELIRFLKQI